jgi:hypothetical protein
MEEKQFYHAGKFHNPYLKKGMKGVMGHIPKHLKYNDAN